MQALLCVVYYGSFTLLCQTVPKYQKEQYFGQEVLELYLSLSESLHDHTFTNQIEA